MNQQQRNRSKDSNQSSKLLSLAENNTVFDLLGQRRITKATAIAQLYFAAPNSTQWSKQHTGVLCFVKDNVKRSYFLRMVDLCRRTVAWEHELYYQISYAQDRKQFHSFAGQDFMIGFNFADADESHVFYEAVQVKVDEYKKKMTAKNNQPPRPMAQADPGISHPGQIPGNGGGPGPITTFNTSSEKKSKREKLKLTKEDISAPSNFKHLAHVGWNNKAGNFEWNNIQDDRWKSLFTEVAGLIGQSDLDKEQVQLIYDMVEKKGGIEAAHRDIVERKNSVRNDPPPPPPGRGRGSKDQVPPPPPPGGRSNCPPLPPRGAEGPPIPDNHPSQRAGRSKGPPPPSNSKIPAPPPDMPADFGAGGGPRETGGAAPARKGGPPAPPPSSAKPGGNVGNLLDSIQSFDKGKLVRPEDSGSKGQTSAEDTGGIVGALATALLSRKGAILGSDSSDEEDTDSDDDEWTY